MAYSDQSEYDTYRMNPAEEQTRLAMEGTILSHIRTSLDFSLFGIETSGLSDYIVSSLVSKKYILLPL
jgi:uncharacterized membrane protein YidH (DUF202 family)